MPEPLSPASTRLDRWRNGLCLVIIIVGIILSFQISRWSEPSSKKEDTQTAARAPFPPTNTNGTDKGQEYYVSGSHPGIDKPDVKTPATDATIPVTETALLPATGATLHSPSGSGPPAKEGIHGRVFLKGTPPPEKPLPLDAACGRLSSVSATTQFYRVDSEQALADAVVWIKEGITNLPALPLPLPLAIDQLNCQYQPYVSAVVTGQAIRVHNSDPLLHNVHVTPTVNGNLESNRAQTPNSPDIVLQFTQPEMFLRMKCDVHSWMFAYISVMPHPYFSVTDEHGRFQLPVLPPGRYVIEVNHRKLGRVQAQITVREGETAPVINFTLTVPSEG